MIKKLLHDSLDLNKETFDKLKLAFPLDFSSDLKPPAFYVKQTEALALPVTQTKKQLKRHPYMTDTNEKQMIDDKRELVTKGIIEAVDIDRKHEEIKEGLGLIENVQEFEEEQRERIEKYLEDIYEMDVMRNHKRQKTRADESSKIVIDLTFEDNEEFIKMMKNDLK